ncbi:MAG: dehydratase [Planctomycetota bacterium]|nr:MAG: dehydratase [Planctomycetota bacterium]
MPGPGKTFDELSLGQVFLGGPRHVSRADIATFATVSGDHTALHCDDAYAATTPFRGVVAHGVLNLAVATGLAYDTGAFEGTVLAVRSMDVRFDRPVRPGDELRLRLKVLELDQRPKPDRGRVAFDVQLKNQEGRVVLSGRWSLLIRRQSG